MNAPRKKCIIIKMLFKQHTREWVKKQQLTNHFLLYISLLIIDTVIKKWFVSCCFFTHSLVCCLNNILITIHFFRGAFIPNGNVFGCSWNSTKSAVIDACTPQYFNFISHLEGFKFFFFLIRSIPLELADINHFGFGCCMTELILQKHVSLRNFYN